MTATRNLGAIQRQIDNDVRDCMMLFEGLRKEEAPRAMIRTLNDIGAKANTQTKTKVALITGMRKQDIAKRWTVKKARWSDLTNRLSVEVILRAYSKPIPVARGLEGRKGAALHRSPQVDKHGKPKRVRTGSSSGLGGLRIGRKFYPNAFVNVIRRNQVIHVMRRRQKATWIGTGPNRKRAPVDVLKTPIDSAIEQQFRPTVERILVRDYAKDFERNLTYYVNRRIGLTNGKRAA